MVALHSILRVGSGDVTAAFGRDGRVAYVIDWVENLTALVRLKVLQDERARQAEQLRGRFNPTEADITLREEACRKGPDLLASPPRPVALPGITPRALPRR